MEEAEEFEERLQWMLDTPQFIDELHLDAFYDAVLQPQVKEKESIRVEITDAEAKEISKNLAAGVDVSPGQIAGALRPVVGGSFEVGGRRSISREKRKNQTHTIELEPVHTAQRQLIQLMVDYLTEHSDRIFFVDDVSVQKEWFKHESIQKTPRSIIFFDLPSKEEAESYGIPKTMLFPMAVEFSSGKLVKLYEKLGLPDDKNEWPSYIKEFDPKDATNVIKEVTEEEDGHIESISYRIPLENTTARLCFEPNGQYNNGTFVYNLIRMGYEHGIRLIGAVYMQPDIRVLATYRK
ncbi:hypothetical protein C494_08372 [Natronorubrum bangense JCM 10635]|uniref:Uncharacterized protein n=2 Tax=Natronorubrum bangense TaxID=61858 RepID=L9WII4_9EURY|nr:hypothetical protein C494_08372 [Natronorubrum bangense JCM 10635]